MILSLLIFLFLSAFFSCSEAALFSLKGEESRRIRGRAFLSLMKDKEKTLTNLLIANTAVNIFASCAAAALMMKIAEKMGLNLAFTATLTTIGIGMTILIGCEIIPKIVGLSNAEKLAPILSPPLWIFFIILSPIRVCIHSFIRNILALFEKKTGKMNITEEEMQALLELSKKEGTITAEEKRMLEKVLKFAAVSAEEVMIKWEDVIKSTPNEDSLLSCFEKSGHSRIPICSDEGKLVGVLHIKDVLPHLKEVKSLKMQEILQPCYIIEHSTKLPEVLDEFKKRKTQIAFVRKEGRLVGLLTMEDVVEEIVGEIEET